MHDAHEGIIWRSENEGKSWKQADEVKDVTLLVEHPYDKAVAFAIGRDTTHYATYNRGESWQSFKSEHPATLSSKPLSFHATKPDWIIFQAQKCEKGKGHWPWGGSKTCYGESYYTTDMFHSELQPLLPYTTQCMFAHSEKEIEADDNLLLCVASPNMPDEAGHSESRLYSSKNWFETKTYVDLGIGKYAKGVVGLGIVSKFMVVAVRSGAELQAREGDPMHMFVSTDGINWNQAQFPHSALPNLIENAYTIVDSSKHSIMVDILQSRRAGIGSLFTSSGEGKYFVESLQNTNRNARGIVDFEPLKGLEGVGIANIVSNKDDVVDNQADKKLQSVITFDDGSNWHYIDAPETDMEGNKYRCDSDYCALHVHGVTKSHNMGTVFSSTAPGFVMAVGSVGDYLLPYDDCDTFLSTDGGVSWKMIQEGAHKYEFGDQGSILVIADDEEPTDHVHYSYDGGNEWIKLDLGITMRVAVLTTIPDSKSQKFLALGQIPRKEAGKDGRYASVFLDFANLQTRQCKDSDFEKWYMRRNNNDECIMGHKQWYRRRKLDARCYVGNKFEDPVGHEDSCPCTEEDYECDFNFVRQDNKCVPAGPEIVPPGTCQNKDDTYMGSSGYRLIPGNTCDRNKGKKLDEKVKKQCGDAKPEDGKVSHVTHPFDSKIDRYLYFSESETILLHMADGTVWQSRNEGYSWSQVREDRKFLAITMHPNDKERAYLFTTDRIIIYTTDTGRTWQQMNLPMDPNSLGIPALDFHPTQSDWLIYTGSEGCADTISPNCHAKAFYTTNNGRDWQGIDTYVRTCTWARDEKLKIDERLILCESYKDKRGSQRSPDGNPLEFIAGRNYYRNKEKLFDNVVGSATFAEYLVVAELEGDRSQLRLQVSMDGKHFAEAQFPPSITLDNHAYTILESSTKALFVHMTMSAAKGAEFGTIFKSNSNGTYYGMSIENVNRNAAGYVDFEKMIGLDGIAVVNVVANPEDAEMSGKKKLQTRITHNDGGSWKRLIPPAKDSLGQEYDCRRTSCSLQLHGYTERRDPKATYSSPSAVGLMLGVGNVGEELAAYDDSDVFLTRDGGFTWEEVHKDAHMWEYGDSGTIIVLVNDEEPTDHVLYTLDEGLTWNTYSLGEKLRIETIQTVPQDTSRRFFLIGHSPSSGGKSKSTLVHLDFSAVQTRQCELKEDDPNHDDFELWSPSENRQEECLFGRQVLYRRRIRDRDCYIGEQLTQPQKIQKNCTCAPEDFECEFNYYRNSEGQCVLVDGAQPLAKDTEEEQCYVNGPSDGFWYERTAYRKIPYSSCVGGERPDQGPKHACPGLIGGGGKSGMFWATIALIPFAAAGLAGYWYMQKGGRAGGIRLDEHRAYRDNQVLATLASVPYFLLGLISVAWGAVERNLPSWARRDGGLGFRRGYETLPIDEDAEILGGYEDDEEV
ncbi:signal sequence binding protein [Trichosporon asahii var. asahii CBS 2479]|uniref:Vacuolar protein sorting/targeting protein 10 n=1 Tax=Trichosporon asahii var. asahii (strain ATCC 90039 / CBS 2479 / JCM 2466 / KCTC 7840 / NBRC 103889/ NCYC 2677 / UAMH 7654) TaxID=1186058 RepID=J5RFP1_TRIAS|nr:signal sequence binding protein [Trichosporon asahii var. asahii CBS 2479]EJT52393.1 signal sequence binding protein [Trichosporon asahii var. asahii CBS 2479]